MPKCCHQGFRTIDLIEDILAVLVSLKTDPCASGYEVFKFAGFECFVKLLRFRSAECECECE